MKKGKLIPSTIFSLLLLISTVIGTIKISNVLPNKYLIPFIIVIVIINILFILLMYKCKIVGRIILYIFTIIISAVSILGIVYFDKTNNFINKIKANNYKIEHYYVLVNKDSSYSSITDLDNKIIGYNDNSLTGVIQAVDYVKNKVDFIMEDYTDINTAKTDLVDKKIEAIIVESSMKNTLDENDSNFNYKILLEFDIKVETDYQFKNVDITNEPFNILISGIDLSGPIETVSRSDVNIIMTVNPKTHEILLTHIPRDYYVQLHGVTGIKDKLTHAGAYGVDMSINTIQDFMGIDINYYVKVNFTTFTEIVDLLGGVDIYSDTSFRAFTNSNCYISKGNNHLGSKCALAFARERHAYATGDRHRGQNQMDVLTAIMNKMTSSEMLTNYDSVLNSLSGSFQTNMESKDIYKLVKLQLKDMPAWDINQTSVTGSDSMNKTYSYPNGALTYVMIPDQTSIDAAVSKIKTIHAGN